MAHDAFISYSSEDKPVADAACARLEAAGIRCWIAPRDVLPGEPWGAAIVRAIGGARVMVLVFSSAANTSRQIWHEVERAVSRGLPLPQRITLFEGTVAENIARLDPQPDSARIVAAAKKADAHDMIVKLPQGYDTRVSSAGGRLSGGQMQRVGLARALYGDPVLLILDEPNSNLDSAGSGAVNAAIRAMKAEGKSVLIMAHRPAAIQECDLLLVLEDGMRKGFGPRDQILRDLVKNHTEILKPAASGAPA